MRRNQCWNSWSDCVKLNSQVLIAEWPDHAEEKNVQLCASGGASANGRENTTCTKNIKAKRRCNGKGRGNMPGNSCIKKRMCIYNIWLLTILSRSKRWCLSESFVRFEVHWTQKKTGEPPKQGKHWQYILNFPLRICYGEIPSKANFSEPTHTARRDLAVFR